MSAAASCVAARMACPSTCSFVTRYDTLKTFDTAVTTLLMICFLGALVG